jgi:hypothetical protein
MDENDELIIDQLVNWQNYYKYVDVFKEGDALKAWKVEVIEGEDRPDKTTTYDVVLYDDETPAPAIGRHPSSHFDDHVPIAASYIKDGDAIPSIPSKDELMYIGDRTKN